MNEISRKPTHTVAELASARALGIERTRFIIFLSRVRAPQSAQRWCLGPPPSTCAHDDVGASGLVGLPGVADFDPASAWGDGDEVTTAIPDGADFDPTTLGSAWGGGDGATAGVGRGSGMNASADDDFLAGVVDFDTPLAWGDNDEATAAMPSAVDDAMVAAAGAAPTVATTVITTGAKRKRANHKRTAQDARKDQRWRLLAIHGSAPGTDTGSDVRRSENTLDGAGPEGRGGWRRG